MLNSERGARLLGFRYRTIFLALGASGVIAAALLVYLVEDATSLETERGHILELDSILFGSFVLALSAAYSYFAATRHLADVRVTSKAILESLAGGVLTLDNEARITIINRAAAEMLELPSKAPYPSFDSFAARHSPIAAVIREALTEKKYVQEFESTFTNSASQSLVLRTTISAQRNDEGEWVGLIVLLRDVSRMVALEQELRKRDRLAAAGSLAAGVAHEVRNPLSAIDLNLRLLRDEVAPFSTVRPDIGEYFNILFFEISRLNHITTSFLQLSRPEFLTKSTVLFEDSVSRAIRLLEPAAREKQITLVPAFDTEEAEIFADASKLEQVWLNILINAMQAMPEGGQIHISTGVTRNNDAEWIVLSVIDQGVGIPQESLTRLFDPYFTTRSEGSGLGLAIADKIISDHNGTITVHSAPGEGAKVTVRLPASGRVVGRNSRR